MSTLVSKLEVLRTRVDYQGAILGFICAFVTVLLLVAQKATFLPISERLNEDRLAMLTQVLPQKYFDNKPLENVVTINDAEFSVHPVEVFIAKKQNATTAVVYQIETEGYGGTITLMMAVNTQGEILGLRVLSHKETPGLADKIEVDRSPWITRFNGESLAKVPRSSFAVKKDGGKFDQFTGATITPRAVVRGVLGGLDFYARHAQVLTLSKDEVKTDGPR